MQKNTAHAIFYFIGLPYIVLVHGLSTVVMDTAFCMVLEIAKSSYDLQLTILSYRILYLPYTQLLRTPSLITVMDLINDCLQTAHKCRYFNARLSYRSESGQKGALAPIIVHIVLYENS